MKMGALRVSVLVVLFRLVSHVTGLCSCGSMSARMWGVQEQVDSLRQLVDVLNMKVGDMVKEGHQSTMAGLKAWGQHTSNVIPVMDIDVKKEIQKLDKRVTDSKLRIESLENYLLLTKSENAKFTSEIMREVNTTLGLAVEDIKQQVINDVISPKLKAIEELSHVPDRLEKIEKEITVDEAVLHILKPRVTAEAATKGVLEINFVDTSNSSSGNFSVNVTEDGHIVCPSGGCSTDTPSDAVPSINASDLAIASRLQEVDPDSGETSDVSSGVVPQNLTDGERVLCSGEGCPSNDTESDRNATNRETSSAQEVDQVLPGLAPNSSSEGSALHVTETSHGCFSSTKWNSIEECLLMSADQTTQFDNTVDTEKAPVQSSLRAVLNALIVKITDIENRIESVDALEKELILLPERMNDVERNISELSPHTYRVNSETSSGDTQSDLGRWTELETSIWSMNRTVENLELQVQNLTDRTEHVALNEPDVVNAAKAIMHNLTDLVLDLNVSVETIRENTTASVQLLTDTFQHGMSLLNASVTEDFRKLNQTMMADVVNMNRTLQQHSAELAADVEGKIQQLNTALEEQALLLNTSVMNNALFINDSLRNDVELLNASLMYELEALNSTIVDRVVTLSKHVEVMNEALRSELDFVNVSLVDGMQQLKTAVMDMEKGKRAIRGWHPNDSLPCPGLLFLGRNKNLVLTTESGTFRSPNLPEEPIPAGSDVVFRCEHPGTSRLAGEQVLSCFSGRWSSRPPNCESLPTIQELRSKKVVDNLPSITYNVSQPTELVIDKYGALVLTPGADLELICIYPKSHGPVVWQHNGTIAAATWAQGADADYAFMLKITDAQASDSGTYACVAPSGQSHSVDLKVEGVQCDPLAAPGNGTMEVIKGSTTLGSRVEFRCHLGFRLVGDADVTCVASGDWSGAVPVCEAIANYRPPSTACTQPPLSGANLGISPVQIYYADKAKVSYVCKDGRRPVGKATTTCMKGRWMGAEPMCD